MNGWIYIEQLGKRDMVLEKFIGFDKIEQKNFVYLRETDGRFKNDKVFDQNADFAIILEGVLLNLSELRLKYGKTNTFELLVEAYFQNGEAFMSELRGPFSGVFYDKQKNISISFANQTGDTATYVFQNFDYFVTSSDFAYIISFLNENNIKYNFNDIAARYIITFGYMIDKSTFAKEIKRLFPGHYIVLKDGKATERTYYKLKNQEEQDCTLEEAVELVDYGFRKAVKKMFDKDLEYGYTYHLADMSAGLDSRMTSWVAKDMGYNNITNISYSQSESNELKMAKNISLALQNDFLHRQLDDANFIYDIDKIISMNSGAGYYIGITGGNRILSDLNFNKYGLEHTGQLGDVVVGTFSNIPKHQPIDINTKMNSTTLNLKFCDIKIENAYENLEQYNMYTRGFLGCLSTHLIRKNYTYAVSPFIDVDFLNLCFSLPLKYRINHKLYFKWIETKYPQALRLPSSRKRLSSSSFAKGSNFIKRAYSKILRETKSGIYKLGLRNLDADPNNMNPFDYWYETIPEVRSFIQEYYEESFPELKVDDDTKDCLEKMFHSSKCFDKLMCLTVLSVNKMFFY